MSIRGARRAARAGAIVVALAVATLVASSSLGRGSASSAEVIGVDEASAAAAPGQHFSIRGVVTGLYPGGTQQLTLTVKNPFNGSLTVTRIHITVPRTDHAGCPTTDLSVSDFVGALVVPAHGTAVTTVPVTLSADAASACQGARFQLRYRGVGEHA